MNGPAWMPWLIGALVLALMAVSALAGVFWSRSRSLPLWQVAQLARELAERQRALEEFLARLERGTRPKASVVEVPSRPAMGGLEAGSGGSPSESSAVSPAPPAPASRRDGAHAVPPSPTLIVVPDLATVASREALPPSTDELQRRHGAVWELADAGARAEQIASHLGLPIGHVELILGLRKPLTTGSGGR